MDDIKIRTGSGRLVTELTAKTRRGCRFRGPCPDSDENQVEIPRPPDLDS